MLKGRKLFPYILIVVSVLTIGSIRHVHPANSRDDITQLEPLINTLEDTTLDWKTRLSAVIKLGKLRDSRSFWPLVHALDDDNKRIRWNAALALGKLGDPVAVEPLIKALNDGDPYVRGSAAWALGEINDSRAVKPLIASLRDNDSYVFGMATDALGEIRDRQAVVPLINILEKETYGRWRAAKSLGKIRDFRAVKHLIPELGNEDPCNRLWAKWALTEITGQDFGQDQIKWQKWWGDYRKNKK